MDFSNVAGSFDYEQDTRDFLISEISSSFIWLNIYNNSYVLDTLTTSLFDVAGLPPKSLHELSVVHFLLQCIENDTCNNIEKILAGFAFNVQRLQEEHKSTIRGSINWSSTFQRRIASGYSDRTLFIATNNRRDNDTLQNQLIRFILTRIIIFSKKIIEMNTSSPKDESAWINLVIQQEIYARRILSNPKIQSVTLINDLTYHHVEITLNSRNKHYRSLAKSGKVFYDIFTKKSVESIRNLIMNRVIAPLDTPTIYELAVLFKVLNSFESLLNKGDHKRYVTIRAMEKTIFEYNIKNRMYRIYYQTVPKELVSLQYSSSLKAHGYVGSSLRPDIIISAESSKDTEFRIIEVKYSQRNAYTYEGLKDVLAYLYDFPSVNKNEDGCIMLATYLDTPQSRKTANKVWIAGYSQLSESIEKFIKKMG